MAKPQSGLPQPAITLRVLRLERGLSLRALSTRIGLPHSTLSKLENGKMELTYDKLLRLSQGLGVDIEALLAAPAAASAAPAALGRRSIARAGRSAAPRSDMHVHHFPAADLLGKMMVPVIIDVHARSVEDMGGLVRHSGEEYLYILSGSMELHSDLYAPLLLDRGDSIYFDSGMAHAYVRHGETACKVLSVCTGPGIQRLLQSAQSQIGDGGVGAEESDVSSLQT